MSFQTCKTFVHLQNTNYIFDEIQTLSDPPIDYNTITTFKAQKGSKGIVKIVLNE